MNEIKIGKRIISQSAPVFIIAEAACNHMCDLELAKKMVFQAKSAGADAIKFQTYRAEKLVCKDARAYWNNAQAVKSQYEYYKKLDKFGRSEYQAIFDCARENDIIAFSTAFDTESASLLNDLGVLLFKIASCDLTDKRLIAHIAKFNKPVILSTGAGTMEEIKAAIDIIYGAGNMSIILMACTLSYPADNQDANLRRIATFKKEFPDLIIGLSDHTRPDENMIIPSIAVALGAQVIEKHYTLDKNMAGSGHSFSAEPDDFKKMAENIRLTESVLGEEQIKVYVAEEKARKSARRSLVADRQIKKGEVITSDLVGIKRPAGGMGASLIDKVVGKVALRNIKKDKQIKLEDIK